MSQETGPVKTRDRILAKSLEMFNAQGEPNVTTNHIADELEISPGNLYYHFRNKDDIIEQLFARFEERIGDALLVPEGRTPNLEDMWLQMHLVFECIWDYRFVYRDLVDLLTRSRKLKMHFSRILKRAHESISKVCTEMVKAGTMLASQREIEAIAQNTVASRAFASSLRAAACTICRAATSRVAMSASLKRRAWNSASFLPNCLRSPM